MGLYDTVVVDESFLEGVELSEHFVNSFQTKDLVNNLLQFYIGPGGIELTGNSGISNKSTLDEVNKYIQSKSGWVEVYTEFDGRPHKTAYTQGFGTGSVVIRFKLEDGRPVEHEVEASAKNGKYAAAAWLLTSNRGFVSSRAIDAGLSVLVKIIRDNWSLHDGVYVMDPSYQSKTRERDRLAADAARALCMVGALVELPKDLSENVLRFSPNIDFQWPRSWGLEEKPSKKG